MLLGKMRKEQMSPLDRDARIAYRTILLEFINGRCSNYQYEDRVPEKTEDPAVSEIENVVWKMYDDFPEGIFPVNRLSFFQKRLLYRALLFLTTDEPYSWCEFALGSSRMTLPARLFGREKRKLKHPIFTSKYWPFASHEAFRETYRKVRAVRSSVRP